MVLPLHLCSSKHQEELLGIVKDLRYRPMATASFFALNKGCYATSPEGYPRRKA